MAGNPGDILLQALDPDPLQAEAKLVSIRTRMQRYFEFNQIPNSEELAQEVISRVIENLSNGKTITSEKPRSYFYGVANNVRKEQLKARHKLQELANRSSPTAQSAASGGSKSDPIEARILLRECLEVLEPSERELLVSYYLDGPKKVSNRLGINLPNLGLKVYRIKEKIRNRVDEKRAKNMLDR